MTLIFSGRKPPRILATDRILFIPVYSKKPVMILDILVDEEHCGTSAQQLVQMPTILVLFNFSSSKKGAIYFIVFFLLSSSMTYFYALKMCRCNRRLYRLCRRSGDVKFPWTSSNGTRQITSIYTENDSIPVPPSTGIRLGDCELHRRVVAYMSNRQINPRLIFVSGLCGSLNVPDIGIVRIARTYKQQNVCIHIPIVDAIPAQLFRLFEALRKEKPVQMQPLRLFHIKEGKHWTRVSLLLKLISSAYAWSCQSFSSEHLDCEESMLPLVHQRTLNASEFSRQTRGTFLRLSCVIGLPDPSTDDREPNDTGQRYKQFQMSGIRSLEKSSGAPPTSQISGPSNQSTNMRPRDVDSMIGGCVTSYRVNHTDDQPVLAERLND
ncbi:hypothetical protein CLF_102825 [Clonorchis sinensis]|uniref:Uncharacterized protein n=1 Tax=Clonorchis sinensis TaxID=79923 RepID=G7Y8L2_CLOSI|nr:hypothetical protein CLF_102825 [Clonorchis sinensis]